MVQEIYIIDNNNELIEKLKESFKRELDEFKFKSIKTQESLSEIFFLQNEVKNFKLNLPFLDIELHPLLLEQLLNMVILLIPLLNH